MKSSTFNVNPHSLKVIAHFLLQSRFTRQLLLNNITRQKKNVIHTVCPKFELKKKEEKKWTNVCVHKQMLNCNGIAFNRQHQRNIGRLSRIWQLHTDFGIVSKVYIQCVTVQQCANDNLLHCLQLTADFLLISISGWNEKKTMEIFFPQCNFFPSNISDSSTFSCRRSFNLFLPLNWNDFRLAPRIFSSFLLLFSLNCCTLSRDCIRFLYFCGHRSFGALKCHFKIIKVSHSHSHWTIRAIKSTAGLPIAFESRKHRIWPYINTSKTETKITPISNASQHYFLGKFLTILHRLQHSEN